MTHLHIELQKKWIENQQWDGCQIRFTPKIKIKIAYHLPITEFPSGPNALNERSKN